MNYIGHGLLFEALLLESRALPLHLCRLAADANMWCDLATPQNVRPGPLAPFQVAPVVTQFYDYQFLYSKECEDWRNHMWTLVHCGGPDKLAEVGPATPGANWWRVCHRWFAVLDTIEAHGTASPEAERAVIAFGRWVHTAMDDVAHAGFWGRRHPANENKLAGRPWYHFWKTAPPAIIHAEFGTAPDEFYTTWRNQAGEKVYNRARFLEFFFRLWCKLLANPRPARWASMVLGSKTEEELARKLRETLAGQGSRRGDYTLPSLQGERWAMFCDAIRSL
jgi:hypothetical protein